MPKTPLGFASLGAATILIVSGIKGVTAADVLAGNTGAPLNPKGGTSDAAPVTSDTVTVGGVPFSNSPNSTSGIVIFDAKPVAAWIVPQLKWARKNGWKGRVTSGYRDPRVVITPSPGLPVAPQGKSNHNGTSYPRGAVDVSDPDGLELALMRYPGPRRLVRGTAINDPIHFSANGH